jgi:type II secretory pathway pseudopilin PulG
MNYKKGFTLIELLLYTSLSAIIIFVIALFIISILQARVRVQTVQTVDQEGNRAMMLITQAVRNANSIDLPALGNSYDELFLNSNDIHFYLEKGVIKMQEGSGDPLDLTSNQVIISNLQFRNLSRPDTPGNIGITFIVEHVH